MKLLPEAITNAIEALSDLPGIGTRSAERLVFSLLKNETGLEKKIGNSLAELKNSVRECDICCHFAENERCPICENEDRSDTEICIVESPMDVLALERTHAFRGKYHVLHGVISPLDRIKTEDIRIEQLLNRVLQNPPTEIIIALPGTTEAEATALFLSEQLKQIGCNAKVSRLARGIPSGGDLDYLDAGTLSRAMMDRREV
jgi:recombination protein RecR